MENLNCISFYPKNDVDAKVFTEFVNKNICDTNRFSVDWFTTFEVVRTPRHLWDGNPFYPGCVVYWTKTSKALPFTWEEIHFIRQYILIREVI